MYPVEPFIAILLAVLTQNTYKLVKCIKTFKCAWIVSICILSGILVFQEARIIRRNIREARSVKYPESTLAAIGGKIEGVSVYLDGQDWQQDAVLAAFLHGDFRPRDGGRAAWENNPSGNALLISPDGTLWQQNQPEPLLKGNEHSNKCDRSISFNPRNGQSGN